MNKDSKIYFVIILLISPFLIFLFINNWYSFCYLLLTLLIEAIFLWLNKNENRYFCTPLIFYSLLFSFLGYSQITKSGIIDANSLGEGFLYLLITFIMFSAPLILNSSLAFLILNKKNIKNYGKKKNIFIILEAIFFIAFLVTPLLLVLTEGI